VPDLVIAARGRLWVCRNKTPRRENALVLATKIWRAERYIEICVSGSCGVMGGGS
jgi:hypothetical protein